LIGEGDVQRGNVVGFVPGLANATVIHDDTRLFALRTITCVAGIAARRYPAARPFGLKNVLASIGLLNHVSQLVREQSPPFETLGTVLSVLEVDVPTHGVRERIQATS